MFHPPAVINNAARAPAEWDGLVAVGTEAIALHPLLELGDHYEAAARLLGAISLLSNERYAANLHHGLTVGTHVFAQTVLPDAEQQELLIGQAAEELAGSHRTTYHHDEKHDCRGLGVGELTFNEYWQPDLPAVRSAYEQLPMAERLLIEALLDGSSADEISTTSTAARQRRVWHVLGQLNGLSVIAQNIFAGASNITRYVLEKEYQQQQGLDDAVFPGSIDHLPVRDIVGPDWLAATDMTRGARTVAGNVRVDQFMFSSLAECIVVESTDTGKRRFTFDTTRLPDPGPAPGRISRRLVVRHTKPVTCPAVPISGAIAFATHAMVAAIDRAQQQLLTDAA